METEPQQYYWEGPYNVRVHNSITNVVASDGFNILYKNGQQTEKGGKNVEPMDETIYRSTYAKLGSDGHYYYQNEDHIIKIIIDVNLVDERTDFIRTIARTQQMTLSNYKKLVGFEAKTFEEAVNNYGCDVCDAVCNQHNPIYTNNQYQGCDICTNCINHAFKTIKPLPNWNPGPVYSLEEIARLNGRTF